MNNNQALFGKYEKGRLLGRGAFAKVYYARNMKNGQSVAIKVIDKKKITGTSLMENIKREISIMRRLRHPNIVRLYEVMASKSKIYFVMEYVKAGELFAKVAKGRFSEDLARKYFQQLVSAIGYCHSRGVFHRDLKPENLLIDDKGDLKVSDFGLSAVKDQIRPESVNDGLLHTLCGTPAYVAPEILTKKGYDGAKVDVWSCGVVLYVLTAGYLPFNDPNLMAMYKKIYKGEFRCPKWMSSDLKRLLSKLLDTNPNTRITLDEITRDPWFLKGCGASFQFSFHKDDYEDEYDQFYLKLEGDHHLDDDVASTSSSIMSSSSSCSLNAFDLISFSSGLDLSGLFVESFNPIVDGDRFVSAEAVHNILETIENVVKDENVNIKLKRRKDYGLDLLGSNGNLVVRFEIRPLTDQLVVVEVMKRAGDSAPYNDIWKNMLKPKLSHLVHTQEESTTTEVSPDPEPENSPS